MDTNLVTRNNKTYIDLSEGEFRIGNESQLNDLVSMCYYHDASLILLDQDNLADEFFNLRSGLAGSAMQKLANYQVRVAVLLPADAVHNERFRELMYEMNQSNHFRFYHNKTEAEAWLTT